MIHEGGRFKEFIESQGLKKSAVAKHLDVSPQNLYDIFKREVLTSRLKKQVQLRYKLPDNFFQSDNYDPMEVSQVAEPSTKYETLQADYINTLKAQNKELQMMVEGDEKLLEMYKRQVDEYKSLLDEKNNHIEELKETNANLRRELKGLKEN